MLLHLYLHLHATLAFATDNCFCILRWLLQLTLACARCAGSCMLYLLLLPVLLLVND